MPPGVVFSIGTTRRAAVACQRATLVAVVEDEALVLAGYEMLFESWGYQVVGATSVAEAVGKLRATAQVPDIIIADYRLKDGETGVDAIHAIRGLCGRAIPSILVTGDTATDRVRQAVTGGLPILHKPVNSVQLQALLTSCLAV